jgi:hypothetical protein
MKVSISLDVSSGDAGVEICVDPIVVPDHGKLPVLFSSVQHLLFNYENKLQNCRKLDVEILTDFYISVPHEQENVYMRKSELLGFRTLPIARYSKNTRKHKVSETCPVYLLR